MEATLERHCTPDLGSSPLDSPEINLSIGCGSTDGNKRQFGLSNRSLEVRRCKQSITDMPLKKMGKILLEKWSHSPVDCVNFPVIEINTRNGVTALCQTGAGHESDVTCSDYG
jgi:hypothetical protein